MEAFPLATTNAKLEVIDGTPRMVDTDLARMLGYDRPRKVRDLIKRLKPTYFPEIHVRSTKGRTSMPHGGEREYEVTEYLLDMQEATIVIVKSETEKAAELTKLVAKVFVEFAKGNLVSAERVAALENEVASIKAIGARLLHGPIGKDQARVLLNVISSAAQYAHGWGPHMTRAQWRAQFEREVRVFVRFRTDGGNTWENLPWHKFQLAINHANAILDRMTKVYWKANQQKLFQSA